jgi:hypothetical protein
MRAARGRNSLFALCIDNADYPTSLEARKLYEVLPNDETVPRGQVRVIDESGEDYLYPARYFRLLALPPSVERLLRRPRIRLSTETRSRLRS